VTQLFDLETDPYEEHDVASSNPEIVAKLHKEYEAWFADVSASRGYAPPKIVLGTTHENPTMLTLQDYRSPETPGWQGPGGHWDVDLATVGNYRFRLLFAAGDKPGKATLKVGGHTLEQAVASGDTECIFEAHGLPEGATLIEPAVTAGKPLAIKYCEVLALDVAKGP
jgi:hypothetical protein